MARIRRILHPSDFSSASRAAFRRALELARSSRAQLIIVHVIEPTMPMVGEGYISPQTYAGLEASARAYARRGLDRLMKQARKAGVRVTSRVLEGSPHERIVRAARGLRSDLIVMGTHGRAGLARLILGSVAGRVVAMAHCPVMTVRGK
jgi:nucleotide-binding universal stress UspA family protein